MKEVYLYRCEKCYTVIAVENDRGQKFYIDLCSSCKDWTDFEKIVTFDGGFYVEESVDENKERKNR